MLRFGTASYDPRLLQASRDASLQQWGITLDAERNRSLANSGLQLDAKRDQAVRAIPVALTPLGQRNAIQTVQTKLEQARTSSISSAPPMGFP
jgi:hypothetical protein